MYRAGKLENVKNQETTITMMPMKENKGYISDTKLNKKNLNYAVLMYFSSEWSYFEGSC